MSLEAMTWAFKQNLDPAPKIVLLALADFASDDWEAWPSMRTLAEKTSLSDRRVRDNIRRLEAAGMVTVEARERSNGSTTSNRYRLAVGADVSSGAPTPSVRPPLRPASAPDPSIEPKEKDTPNPSSAKIDEAYDALYFAWPKKEGREPGRRAWRALTAAQREAVVPLLVAHANAHRQHTPPQFIPRLSTMIREQRWDDALAVSRERGTRKAEPAAPKQTIPVGHRPVWNEAGYVVGSEPVS